MEHIPQMAEKGAPGSRNAAYSRYGKSFHTGGVTGSIPVSPTIISKTYGFSAELPGGSPEPVHRFPCLWTTLTHQQGEERDA